MPERALWPCRYARCPKLVRPPERYCPAHRRESRRFDERRPNATARGYDRQWRKARAAFLRRHPLCRCGAAAAVVDHIVPHRGDRRLFADHSNWQPLCKRCHDRKTAAGG